MEKCCIHDVWDEFYHDAETCTVQANGNNFWPNYLVSPQLDKHIRSEMHTGLAPCLIFSVVLLLPSVDFLNWRASCICVGSPREQWNYSCPMNLKPNGGGKYLELEKNHPVLLRLP